MWTILNVSIRIDNAREAELQAFDEKSCYGVMKELFELVLLISSWSSLTH